MNQRVRTVDYCDTATPEGYFCAFCGVTDQKLWRSENARLACGRCALRDLRREDIIDESGRVLGKFGEGRTDQIGTYMPAVPTPDGWGLWGYTSVPAEARDWWRRLPTEDWLRPRPRFYYEAAPSGANGSQLRWSVEHDAADALPVRLNEEEVEQVDFLVRGKVLHVQGMAFDVDVAEWLGRRLIEAAARIRSERMSGFYATPKVPLLLDEAGGKLVDDDGEWGWCHLGIIKMSTQGCKKGKGLSHERRVEIEAHADLCAHHRMDLGGTRWAGAGVVCADARRRRVKRQAATRA